MTKLLRLLSVCLFLAIATNSICWGENMKIYKSPFHNFEISFPETWGVEDSKSILQLKYCYAATKDDYLFNGGYDRNSVRVTVLVYEKSSAGYVDFQELKKFNSGCKKCRVWGEGKTTIDNLNAEYYIYFHPIVSKTDYVKVYRIFKGPKVYDLNYIAPMKKFDEYLPIAEEIIKSIKISE